MERQLPASFSCTLNDPPPPPMITTSAGLPAPEATSTPADHQRGRLVLHNYYGHPRHHPLLQVSLPYIFTCVACREYGAGERLTCPAACDFNLHLFCALAPPSLPRHPFHTPHQLVFFPRPDKGGFVWSRCDVCRKAAKGGAFRCSACSFTMHPCCSTLGAEMCFPVHAHPLRISAPAGVDGDGRDRDVGACGVCRRRRPGRVYCCSTCDFRLHAVCAKAMRNGLYDCGIQPPEKKGSRLLAAARRVASQALLELLGGIIEGIGEGLGQALVETIGKSGGSPRDRSARRTHKNS